jgi:FKBP-type peptidyl-prolyl cis-trans isomerase (trigger factor)
MQVTEVANEGLKRGYTVVVPAGDIAAERDKRLAELGRDLRLPGFRPGKVPAKVVQQRYGQAVLGEVLEQSVNKATDQLVTDRGLRPALQPKVELVNFAPGADLEFKIDVEVLPEIPLPDFSAIAVERLKSEPTEEQVSKTLEQIASRNRTLEDVAEARPAATGDVLVCDFVGRLAGGPANRLRNPAGAAAPGAAETALPEHWTPQMKAAAEVVGRGESHVDIRFHGDAALTNQALNFGALTEAPLTAPAEWTLRATLAVVGGSLDGIGSVVVRLRSTFEGGASGEVARSADVLAALAAAGGAAVEAEATRTLAAESAGAVTGGLVFATTGPFDVTLRIAGASLTEAGAAEGSGEPFPGGTATDTPIEVNGAGFIPGFTEQLEGLAPGETRTIAVTFPAEYGSKALAGKAATFEVAAKSLKRPVLPAIDDAFAATLGFENLEKLKDAVRGQLQGEYDSLARLKVKRALLDGLATQASFPVPEGMVEAEFGQIWQRIEADLKAGRLDDDDKGKDEEALKAEYRGIAERRIRLGLLLSEIGRTNNITVSADELARAMRQEAARYPGQEQQVMEFFRKNPQSAENLRSPIFEEKVVDFMLELAQVTERSVAPEELTAAAAA